MKRTTVHRARLRNIELAYLEMGHGPLVLCVHGFPDTAYSFLPVMRRLSKAGYRVVAPFLRGYLPSDLAPDGDYRITTVADDLLALIDALGAGRAYLVGHDWGAVATYIAATKSPDKVVATVTAAVPHLRRFLLRPTARQLYRSRYIGFFQLPRWPEHRVAEDDFTWLRALVREWSPRWGFTDRDLAPIIASLSVPEYRKAALAYYRSLPKTVAAPSHWGLLTRPMPVPAKVIAGVDDGCIGVEMFEDQDYCFAAGYEFVRIEGAGHFMHCEQPVRFADEVIAFLGQHPL